MQTLLSLTRTDRDLRRVLRHRFAQNLSPSEPLPSLPSERYADEDVLTHLLALTIARPNSVEEGRTLYTKHKEGLSAPPSFEELIASGWLRVSHGRLRLGRPPMDDRLSKLPLTAVLQQLSADLMTASCSMEPGITTANHPLAALLLKGGPRRPDVHAKRPEWVAGRLWERCVHIKDPIARILFWHERWLMLGEPEFAPSKAWSESDAAAFVEAVLALLNETDTLLTWAMIAEQAGVYVHTRFSRHDESVGGASIASLVDGYLGLTTHGDGLFLLTMMFAHRGLVQLALHDADVTEYAAFPHPTVGRLIAMAHWSPEILATLLAFAHDRPRVYADLFADDKISPVALVQITRRPATRFPSLEGVAYHDEELRITAGRDGLEVIFNALLNGAVDQDLSEIAALIAYAYDNPKQVTPTRTGLLAGIRSRIHTLPADIATRLTERLIPAFGDLSMNAGSFVAALDIAGPDLQLEKPVTEAFMDAYATVMAGTYRSPTLQALEARPAMALAQLAIGGSRECWKRFSNAPCLRERLTAKDRPGADYGMRALEAGRALRDHVRLLCRAVIGWSGEPPVKLVYALASGVRIGASANRKKRTVDAFSINFEQPAFGSNDEPIAYDLARALNRTRGKGHVELLDAICLISEPSVLALVHDAIPVEWRPEIEARLKALDNHGASQAWAVTAVLARARTFILGGRYDAARSALDSLNPEQLGRLPGLLGAHLHSTLQLAYHQGDHDTILSWALRAKASDPERDALDHFQGLALLNRPDSARHAEALFLRLSSRHPDVGPYWINLIAARLALYLKVDLFSRVDRPQREAAKAFLVQLSALSASVSNWLPAEADSFYFNYALLLLALDRPDTCLEILDRVSDVGSAERKTAYGAVALHRLGKSTDAIDRLRLLLASGDAGIVATAALAHVTEGRPFSGPVGFVEDVEARVFKGLVGFRSLPPGGQIRAWHGGQRSIDEVLLTDIRASAAQMSELAVLLRGSEKDQTGIARRKEDDLTALLRALLEPRAQFFGWTWASQGPGGISAKRNPGKRDLALVQGDSVHTVVEAIVCDEVVTRKAMKLDLISHLQRLLGYADCESLFYVTYSYVPEPATVEAFLLQMASKNSLVPNLRFVDSHRLPIDGTLVPGFVAHYKSGQRPVNVYFLVVDMAKEFSHAAGLAADVTNPRTNTTTIIRKKKGSHAKL